MKAFVLAALCLLPCHLASAQQFDNFGETFDGFELVVPEGEETDVPSLGDTGILLDNGTGDIQLDLGGGQDGIVLETFPGVTGPVTSVSQPETVQGTVVSLRALDKTLGQPTDLELSIGQTVLFGRIAIRAIECRFPAEDPASDGYAHLQVLNTDGETLFDGWMVASSPALSALEHPRYDVWVLSCSAA